LCSLTESSIMILLQLISRMLEWNKTYLGLIHLLLYLLLRLLDLLLCL